MNKPLVRAALLASAVAVSVLAPAASASAQKLVVADAAGDSWQEVYHDDQDPTYVEAGSQPNADITKVVVRHGSRAVTLRTKYAELVKGDDMLMGLAKIRTNEGAKRIVFGFRAPGMGTDVGMFNRRGDVRCRGLAMRPDWAADAIDIVVPRACLSKPRWVQVVVGAVSSTVDPETEQDTTYVDVAGSTGHGFTGWSAKVRRG